MAICRVNQPSPEHRSMTSIPGLTPTALSTPAGSGHSASHHPAVGISVPSKNPAGLLVIRMSLLRQITVAAFRERFTIYVPAPGHMPDAPWAVPGISQADPRGQGQPPVLTSPTQKLDSKNPSEINERFIAPGVLRTWQLILANVSNGSFATDRCAMKIGPCPQCPESDGGRSRCRPSRWATSSRQSPFAAALELCSIDDHTADRERIYRLTA